MPRLAARLGVAGTLRPAALPPAAQSVSSAVTFGAGAKVGLAAALIAAAAGGWGAVWYAARRAEAPVAASASQPQAAPPAPKLQAAAELAASNPDAAKSDSERALADEIARLDRARSLLAGNRAKPALAALSDYDRAHPRGALRQEAAVLRIDALRRAGDRTRARELAQRFLADNPDSPHAPRVRALAFDDAR
jgi:hypothetical protein